MLKQVLVCLFTSLLVFVEVQSQSSTQPRTAAYSYYHPSKDKESWQRLNLQLSSTYLVVVKEGLVDHDTCLDIASRYLGLSRFSVLAAGFGDKKLQEQSRWIDQWQPAIGRQQLAEATGRKRLQILLLLGSYYAFHPDSYKRYKDSVDHFLGLAIAESKSLKEEKMGRIAQCILGKVYVCKNDPKGDSIYNQLIRQSRNAGDKEMEARATAYRGIYKTPLQTTFMDKVNDLQTASDLYHKLGNTEAEINVLTDLGYMLVVSGQLEEAKTVFQKALDLAEAIGFPYTHYNIDALAMVNMYQGKFGEPLRYAIQTIKVAESRRDSIGWGSFYARLSDMYGLEGREKEQHELTQKAADRFIIARDPVVFGVLSNIVARMCGEGHAEEALNLVQDVLKKVNGFSNVSERFNYYNALATCYTFLDRFDLAEKSINTMDSLENLAELVRGPLQRGLVHDQFAQLYLKKKEYGKAKEYFEKLISFPVVMNQNLNSRIYACQWLLHIDSIMRDNASMALHYKKYAQLLDSNFRVTKIRQAEELRVSYETEEKENQIAILNEQASQAAMVLKVTLAGIAAVLIIAVLLYRQNRLRRKNNKLITEKNEQLEQLITDREWLLKEIHHRVKNNLQIVMSLLNSQAVFINNDAALTAIQDSKRRVYAMSLIHQKLYQSDNIASIAMPGYVNELVSHVQDSLATRNRIKFEEDIEALNLDVSQAIPLGLIINECLVNAIKYAFPDGRNGMVRISLQRDDAGLLVLNIVDNGIGLPTDIDLKKNNSLGLGLVQGLTKQLKGRFNITSGNGLHITISFAELTRPLHEETLAEF